MTIRVLPSRCDGRSAARDEARRGMTERRRAPAECAVSAFGSPAGAADSKVVIVLMNENAVDVPLKASVNAAGRTLTSLTPYRTTAGATFEQETAVPVSATAFSISLPAKSITTLVN